MSDLQKIKEQVSIRDVAESLLHLEKQDGKYKYPGERTASIQLYTDTQSFNDFGRNVGGDIFKLVSHIEGIDFKESLDEIVNFFQIRDVENKDEESSRPRWINYLEEKKKCRYIEHYNYSLISLKENCWMPLHGMEKYIYENYYRSIWVQRILIIHIRLCAFGCWVLFQECINLEINLIIRLFYRVHKALARVRF